MKIAICFSGHLREFFKVQYSELEKNIENLKNNGHEVCCFFSVWETYNGENHRQKSIDYQNSIIEVSDSLFTDFYKKYSISFEIEEYKKVRHNFILSNYHPTIRPEGNNVIGADGVIFPFSMFYKLFKANLLKQKYELENNIMFDIVVRYRANTLFNNLLNFDHVKPWTIYSSSHGYNCHSRGLNVPSSCMTQDIFFYGDNKTMDTICDLYNNIKHVLYKYEGNPSYMGPERMLYDWIVYDNNINHEICPIGFTYYN